MSIRLNRIAAFAAAASVLLTACSGHGGSTSSVLPSTGNTGNQASKVNPNVTVTNIYGGGSTLASLLYRQWMDYYGVALPPDPQGAPNGLPVNAKYQYYYAGIGSGAGRAAFLSQTPSTTTPVIPPNVCPGGGTSCYPYPAWHYSGSDATFSSTEISCYQAGCSTYPNAVQPVRGQYVQIPTLATAITLFYNPSGQTIGSKGLRLSRNTYCGIWEGSITSWADPAITSDNGGVVVSNQPIIRVVRADGSGTTFLLLNHLNTVCQNLPNPSNDWTGPAAGGGPITWPNTNGNVVSGTGSGGVVSTMSSTPGGIGYVGPSFVAPIVSGGFPTAKLQNGFNYTNGHNVFTAPTVQATINAFKGVNPPTLSDPFDLATLVPDPQSTTAYPIVGFTWLEAYQCYNTKAEAAGMKGFIDWYAIGGAVGTTAPDVILEQQGLAPLTASWKKAVRNIASNIVPGPVTNVCTI